LAPGLGEALVLSGTVADLVDAAADARPSVAGGAHAALRAVARESPDCARAVAAAGAADVSRAALEDVDGATGGGGAGAGRLGEAARTVASLARADPALASEVMGDGLLETLVTLLSKDAGGGLTRHPGTTAAGTRRPKGGEGGAGAGSGARVGRARAAGGGKSGGGGTTSGAGSIMVSAPDRAPRPDAAAGTATTVARPGGDARGFRRAAAAALSATCGHGPAFARAAAAAGAIPALWSCAAASEHDPAALAELLGCLATLCGYSPALASAVMAGGRGVALPARHLPAPEPRLRRAAARLVAGMVRGGGVDEHTGKPLETSPQCAALVESGEIAGLIRYLQLERSNPQWAAPALEALASVAGSDAAAGRAVAESGAIEEAMGYLDRELGGGGGGKNEGEGDEGGLRERRVGGGWDTTAAAAAAPGDAAAATMGSTMGRTAGRGASLTLHSRRTTGRGAGTSAAATDGPDGDDSAESASAAVASRVAALVAAAARHGPECARPLALRGTVGALLGAAGRAPPGSPAHRACAAAVVAVVSRCESPAVLETLVDVGTPPEVLAAALAGLKSMLVRSVGARRSFVTSGALLRAEALRAALCLSPGGDGGDDVAAVDGAIAGDGHGDSDVLACLDEIASMFPADVVEHYAARAH